MIFRQLRKIPFDGNLSWVPERIFVLFLNIFFIYYLQLNLRKTDGNQPSLDIQ